MNKKLKPANPENMEKMAQELMAYLIRNNLQHDTALYVNNKRYSFDTFLNGKRTTFTYRKKEYECFVEDFPSENIPVEYNNPDTLTVTFEGPLYYALNAYDVFSIEKTEDDLNHIFNKYGNKYPMYFEPGYAWSFAVYE